MRTTAGTFVVSAPDFDAATECLDCGFDAVVAYPIHIISEAGVSPFGFYKACARCYDEASQ